MDIEIFQAEQANLSAQCEGCRKYKVLKRHHLFCSGAWHLEQAVLYCAKTGLYKAVNGRGLVHDAICTGNLLWPAKPWEMRQHICFDVPQIPSMSFSSFARIWFQQIWSSAALSQIVILVTEWGRELRIVLSIISHNQYCTDESNSGWSRAHNLLACGSEWYQLSQPDTNVTW